MELINGLNKLKRIAKLIPHFYKTVTLDIKAAAFWRPLKSKSRYNQMASGFKPFVYNLDISFSVLWVG